MASLPLVCEKLGQPFMKLGTKATLGGKRNQFSDDDIHELATLNQTPGTARAFARTVRGVIDIGGQHRSFFQRAHEIHALPPICVLWGAEDPIIPIDHGERFAEVVQGVTLRRFERCGHYLHREEPGRFVHEVRSFLDAPSQPSARYLGA
jgi:pimeloyl-ACP methyl ester carboxylesterase